ncbi:ribose 1,5-bisphosphokinase [Modicisalibacter muralis]|uniref:Ribose 1,5-bisphosphate phosphokinase PhnN n=1 Tax=Modicisalibacter muralis TaxID=119000 RepID=A0A1G9H1W4_9GAMM|nr:ribose 1,5-bisphosphokinase [Halomonas muralis]SDL06946.1 ribose 1,5-bisphosphokinase [Halomonas muralis]
MRTEPGAERGRLVYLMGASGVGKDSLLGAVRQCRPDWLVAHRYITRPSGHGENCVSLTPEEFARRRQLGLFCLDWQAHGLDYAIGIEAQAWLDRGQTVVVNGSRRALERARQRFGARLLPVLVTAEPAILRERLIQRGRETPQEIDQRLARHRRMEVELDDVAHIDNSGELHHAVTALQALIAMQCAS